MTRTEFNNRLADLVTEHRRLLERKNEKMPLGNGVFDRYKYPVLTAEHSPLFWRYDLDYETNPYLMERIGVNAALNPGAIYLNGKFHMMVRVEGADRKSFFAIAESTSPVDGFRYWDYPVTMPETDDPDTNVYDIRLTKHQDGWIYGVFCTERRDPDAPPGDTSSAVAQCGIARTRDLKTWERLDDLKTGSPQQRNVVLHPEFVDGKYAFYTRPQDGFISAGSGGGIGWGLSESIEHAVVDNETIVDQKVYHTIKELKNGDGPPAIKTKEGWIHIAHGVRNTAAGLRYVLYAFVTDLDNPKKVIYAPGGYFAAPQGEERIGDVSNVLFCNGLISLDNGEVYIYYASSDTRIHVAATTVDRLLDYCKNTPPDNGRSFASVEQRNQLIARNLKIIESSKDSLIKQAGT